MFDLPAEFYLETVEKVFQTFELARGALSWRGRPVRTQAIRRTWLLTVEGERDDICAVGQTVAAHDLCSGGFLEVAPRPDRRGALRGVQRALEERDLPRGLVDPRGRGLGYSCAVGCESSLAGQSRM